MLLSRIQILGILCVTSVKSKLNINNLMNPTRMHRRVHKNLTFFLFFILEKFISC